MESEPSVSRPPGDPEIPHKWGKSGNLWVPSAPKDSWWRSGAFWISIVSLIFTGISAWNANRSANAAAKSASAALTNAEWVTYQRNPQHDLLAKVLRTTFVAAGGAAENADGVAYVDLALINNGNQSEIVRRLTLYYCNRADSQDGFIDPRALNSQLPKGEKQVLHLVLDRRYAFVGKEVWLKLGVTAIGPDAEDLETTWAVARFNLAVDGKQGQWTEIPSSAIRVLSNERLPQQHLDRSPLM